MSAALIRGLLCGGILAGSALGWPVSLFAAVLSISPVVIEMKAPHEAPAITVTNRSNRAILLQADTLVWRQENGSNRYERTDELLAVPAIAEIPPNSSQIFRVALRSPAPAPVERTYRLLLEDITEEVPSTERAPVELRVNHNLPVMLAPSGKSVRGLRLKPCTASAASESASASGKELCIRLQNKGNSRVKITAITLSGESWEHSLALETGVNILVGAEREWHVPTPKHNGELRDVHVRTAKGETLRVELE